MFQLVRYCGMRYEEAWNLPVEIRHWWMKRTEKENAKSNPSAHPTPSGPVVPFGGKL